MTKAINRHKRIRIYKNYPSERLEKDLNTIKRVVSTIDAEIGISDNPLLSHDFTTVQKEIDTLILYLRRAHAYDYFTASQHENERMMAVKTAVISLRMQTNKEDTEGVYEKVRERNEERVSKGSPFPDYMAMLR